MEKLLNDELILIKGGENSGNGCWVWIDGRWVWIEPTDYDPTKLK